MATRKGATRRRHMAGPRDTVPRDTKTMFQVVTGDEGGLLKRVCIAAADGFDAVKAQQVTVDAFEGGPQSRARAVEALAWCGLRDDTDGLHSAFVSVTKCALPSRHCAPCVCCGVPVCLTPAARAGMAR